MCRLSRLAPAQGANSISIDWLHSLRGGRGCRQQSDSGERHLLLRGRSCCSGSDLRSKTPLYVGEIPQGTAIPQCLCTTLVTFNGFTFNPAVASITPLWTFTYDGLTYSYDATSVVADFNASLDEWDIGGSGMAMITGFTSTPGTWTVNLSQTDASFAFDATSGASGSVSNGSVSDSGFGPSFCWADPCWDWSAFAAGSVVRNTIRIQQLPCLPGVNRKANYEDIRNNTAPPDVLWPQVWSCRWCMPRILVSPPSPVPTLVFYNPTGVGWGRQSATSMSPTKKQSDP